MKREKVYVDERRERIRDILREKSQVRVEALAEELKVSVITIRRDLQYLEEQKQLIRVYGGAVAVREQGEQTDEIQLYRDLIARYAASLVEDGDTLFLNTSRNVRQILRYITKKMCFFYVQTIKFSYIYKTSHKILKKYKFRQPA